MRIPRMFIPEINLDKKVNLLIKQCPYAKECAELEEEISKLQSELKKCEDRKIKNPDYYSILTDPYQEEREVYIKIIRLELRYLEIKEYR